jgi:hypothetical protein
MATVKAGKNFILNGSRKVWEGVTIINGGDMGSFERSYKLGQYINTHCIVYYRNHSADGANTDATPQVAVANRDKDNYYNDFLSPTVMQLNVAETYELAMSGDYIIYNSVADEIPDVVNEMFSAFVRDNLVTCQKHTYTNTDGVSQDVLIMESRTITVEGLTVNNSVTFLANNLFSLEVNSVENSKVAWAYTSGGSVLVYANFDWNDYAKKFSMPSTNFYPHAPQIELKSGENGKFIRVTCDNPAHGNIYMNGAPSPTTTYITARSAPYIADIQIEIAGAYTANVISEVPVSQTDLPYPLFAYSELSEILIVEYKYVTLEISFNEYTGEITTIAPENSVKQFQLKKYINGVFSVIETNTTGKFKITESGSYLVGGEGKNLYQIHNSRTINVETTLDTPNVYIEFSNPSQLGFDEVELANVYDIYRVSDDGGEDELVKSITVGVATRAINVKRAEKIFRVVLKDDGYSL